MEPLAPDPKSKLLQKRKLLIQKQLSNLISTDTVKPRKTTEPAPLSFAQQRLWFLDQLLPGTPLYNIFNILHFPTQINYTVLHKCLQELVRRHESLRTHFVISDGEPVQIVAPELFLPLPVIDLQKTAYGSQETDLQQIVNQEARKPFDLSSGPLLRTTLIRRSDQDYLFLLSMHHIITDGWSMNIFFKELATLYEAYSRGLPTPLNNLPIQYPDYAIWQRNWLRGDKLKQQLQYWEKKLEGFTTQQLPTDYPRSSVQTFNGTVKNFELPAFYGKALKKTYQENGVTLFMVLLAIFKVLVFRLTGQRDIMVGSPISGRNRTELEGLIGFFVNTLVFRSKIDGADSFTEVLKKVKQTALEAFSNQDLPFEMLVERLQPERDLSRNPLFQVMFQVLTDSRDESGEKAALPEIDMASSKFDLTLSFNDHPHKLTGSIEYNTDLFKPAAIERIIRIFKALAGQIIENPKLPIRELPLLSPEEYRQLVQEWNNTATDYPATASIPGLFSVAAARYPEKVACFYEAETITYAELDLRANQLARYLKRQGVGRETTVGICMDRSVDLITSLLGVLKAGGCYLPLDLDYPSERLATMLEDAQPALIISKMNSAGVLPKTSIPILHYEKDHVHIVQESRQPPAVHIDPDMPAYVMYTSGSTGRPKGIIIPQRGVIRLVFDTNYIELKATDTIAQSSNTAFDASVFEIWGALLHGATLVGIPKEISIAPKEYSQKIEQHNINTLFLTTALFNQFAQQAPWAFRSMDQVLFGGEAVTPKWVYEVLQNSPLKRLLHVYGPTESTTFTTWHHIRHLSSTEADLPIGRPIGNTRVYVLDQYLEPVPPGVAGELYIGGAGLARGYLNKPGLTAANFLPDPFSEVPGARMYRTKDLVKQDERGNLVFLGRVDNQVKLRGFRIELGEIETHLIRLEGVNEAIVILDTDGKGKKRLIAYLVPADPAAFDKEAAKVQLRNALPDYMIPSVIVVMESFPCTPNGKIDRKKLPAPARPGVDAGRGTVTLAATNTQKIISDSWKEILGLEEVGIHDNFFDLGGHSLLIAQVNNRLQKIFKRNIPLIDLFQFPTISALSAHLDATAQLSEVAESKSMDHIHERISRQKKALSQGRHNRKKLR